MSDSSSKACRAAIEIIHTLRSAGHAALLAGGCVRDRLLGIAPKDYDVATDALPSKVEALFPRSRKVGAKFGVVLVRRHGCDVEVATFRADGPYSDGRHPDEVRFGSEIEDARRRDFTINGLFLDPLEDRIIDHVGGRADLQARLIRTIGDPARRFGEDHLRMLRAVRFAARLDFQMDPETKAEIVRLAEHLRAISAERIWMELEWILTAPSRARGWRLLVETGLRKYLCEDWPADAGEDERIERRLAKLPPTSAEAALALAAATAERTPTQIRRIARGLRLSNQLADATEWLTGSLSLLRPAGPSLELWRLKELMAKPDWPNLLDLFRAALTADGALLDPLEHLKARASQILPDNVAPPPWVTGEDLMTLGLEPGPRFGEILRDVYRAQLNEDIRSREQAMEWIRRRTEGEVSERDAHSGGE